MRRAPCCSRCTKPMPSMLFCRDIQSIIISTSTLVDLQKGKPLTTVAVLALVRLPRGREHARRVSVSGSALSLDDFLLLIIFIIPRKLVNPVVEVGLVAVVGDLVRQDDVDRLEGSEEAVDDEQLDSGGYVGCRYGWQ